MKKKMYISPEMKKIELECNSLLIGSVNDGTLDAVGESIGGDSSGIDY